MQNFGLDLLSKSQTTRLVAAVRDVLEVRSVELPQGDPALVGDRARKGLSATIQIYGQLRMPSEQAYALVAERFRALGHIALLRQDGASHMIAAVHGKLPQAPSRPWVALGLFIATLISVLFVGSNLAPEQIISNPLRLLEGWPFAASLLGILVAHELGHFAVARRLGVPASFPYFIPLPISILGTMGAVIQLKAPPRNRRQFLAVAAAGPLAGFIVTLPVLVLGLTLSEVQQIPAGIPFFSEGNSLLYAGLKMLIFGQFLPAGGYDVFLHPVALAGWAGLLVTGLNLLPAGQLDGGHIAYGILGCHARTGSYVVILALVALSFLVWREWLIWAGLIFLLGRNHPEPLDDVTQLRSGERVLAIGLLILFVLIFTPIPMVIG